MSLRALLDPASVAVVGASDNPDKIGGRPIRFLQDFGFRGRILPVNPGRAQVQGLDCFASVADLPEAPDAAIVAVAGEGAEAAVAACAARGVKACVVMASGFGELGPEGKAAEARMRVAAHAAGMRIVGPNSQGLANFGTGAVLSFSTMFVEAPPAPGPVACISQSGAMSVAPYGLLRARGIGVGHCHATGNDCDVTVGELAAEVVQDPEVRLLLMYLETLGDPAHLARAAALARARGVPIVALKSGRSPEGARAAASHTGAIATEDRVVDAFFARHGIWRAEGTSDLVRAAELHLHGWRPRGRRLAVISNSGATCVLATDAAAAAGLPMARFAEATEARLAAALPGFASARNPVDITAALLSDSGLFGEVLPAVGADAAADMVLIGIPVSGRGYDLPRFAADAGAFLRTGGRPVAVAAPQTSVRAAFAAEGLPVFAAEDEAVAALAQFAAHQALMEAVAAADPPLPSPAAAAVAAAAPGGFFDEAASLDLIAAEGISTVRRRVCAEPAEALAFLAECPDGIVLKALSAAIPHKSEHGLVRLDLREPAAAEAAFAALRAGVERLGLAFEGVLAAEMAPGGHEMVVGGRLDPVFGPVVVIGDGGLLVEAAPDNALLLAPIDPAEVRRALAGLRIGPLFDGVRGRAPLSVDAVAEAAAAVARLLAAGKARSIDVNPLRVTEDGALALDALVERGPAL